MISRHLLRRIFWGVGLLLCLGSARPVSAQDQPRFLAREDILLYGAGLRVEPARQTVPKDIATIVSTLLQAPNAPSLPPFPQDAVVRATLRGPSFTTPLELTGQPNTPLNIPPLTVAGLHTVDNIRVISNGEVLLYGAPESVQIEVIEKLLVTQVTARPLSAAEIREKGLVFDKSSFQAYNFAAAFAVDSGPPININFPVVLPTIEGAANRNPSATDLALIDPPAVRDLATIIPDTLRLQTKIPNLSVVGFTLKAPPIKGQNFVVPPIPGVVVIPGDIGFLNQFFSVMLMVGNVAPDGSNLVVSNLRAQIVLPPGADTVVGSGDDPLRMAMTAAGETPRIQFVRQPGPDGKVGTADDIETLGPGQSGNAEYLVEGRREGTHIVEMEMTGTLNGLPVGPVEIRGRAAGAVLVRNPTFTLTFTHPDIVNAGEPYSLDVTVTNTSQSPANFVSVNLYERNISGASLVGEPTKQIESIPAGDSATISFDLISRITGKVTAATLDSDENVAGRFALKTAVGELGVPLSPDSLVLPKEANSLPASLRNAALGLLGKAYAVATAPAAALPKDVRRFTKQIVWDRAVEVAEAGFRYSLREPLADTAAQLLMDFVGSRYALLPQVKPAADLEFSRADYLGFDEIRRRSVRGDVFATEIAKVLNDGLQSAGGAAFHGAIASKWSYRPAHISVLASANGPLPISLALLDPAGRRTGPTNGTPERNIPFSDYLRFAANEIHHGTMALVATPEVGEYIVQLHRLDGAAPGATFDLSVVLPAADGTLKQVVFTGVTLNELPALEPTAGAPYSVRFQVFSGGGEVTNPVRGPTASANVVDPPPTVLGAVQQAEADVLTCEGGVVGRPGRVIAVLFSEEITPAEAQDRIAAIDITRFSVDGNSVRSVALQPGRRVAFLALRDPIGPYVPRQLTVREIADRAGQPMIEQSVPIEATVTEDGAVVSGQVLRADGTPAAFANIRLLYHYVCGEEVVTVGISSKNTDEQGRYSWDYVLKPLTTKLVAVDGETDEFRELRFNVARGGQRLNVNVVFLGRGTLTGRVLREDGTTPVPGAAIRVTSQTDQSQYGATTDADGRYSIGAIPVGPILVESVSTAQAAQIFISEHIPFAGATVTRDIILLDVDPNGVQVRRGRLFGHVLRTPDDAPVPDVPVVAYYQNRSQTGVRCPPGANGLEPAECPVALVRTDLQGAFAFEQLSAGQHRIYAFDQAALLEGQARINLPADGAIEFNLVLNGGLGTVRGRVVDSAGTPVTDARVGGGLSLTTAGADGRFVLTDVPIGRRSIVAVSDALGAQGSSQIDIVRPGDEVDVTIVLQSMAAVAGKILAADGVTPVANIKVYLFYECRDNEGNPSICVVGETTSDATGGYRIDKVALGNYSLSAFKSDFSDGNIVKVALDYDRQVFRTDLVFRGGNGRVTGVVYDDDGQTPLKAAVSVSGDQLVIAGGRIGASFQYVQNFKITETDFTTGRFSMNGLWVGPFTIRAAGQFSPDPVSLESHMPSAGATVDLTMKLQATSQIAGVIYQPDGVTPVGANVIVKYKSNAVKVFCAEDEFGDTVCTTIPQGIQEEVVVTNEQGEYWFPVVNAGAFTITVEDPASLKQAEAKGAVRAGERAELGIRLLGVGRLTVRVLSSDNVTPIPGARVEVKQLDHPRKTLTRFADANGTLVFTGGDAFTEGEFVVSAVDVRDGFAGRAAGRITQDGQEVTVRVFLFNATGTVGGRVFRPDGITPVANAEVVISNVNGPLAFAVTDAEGAYQQDTIPLGAFTVDVFDAVTASRGFASGRIDLNQQTVPVDITLGALGVIRGVVLEAGSQAPLKGWQVDLVQTTPTGRTLPQRSTTTGVDGGFSFPGAGVGTFRLRAWRSGVSGSEEVTGTVDRAGAAVDVPIVVPVIRQAFGRIQGTVFDAGGAPVANAQVQILYAGGQAPLVAGPDGRFELNDVPLGRFTVLAQSQTTNNAGAERGELTFDGVTVDVPVTLVGLSTVSGTVERANGSLAEGVRVELTGSPATGCEGPCVAFTGPDGAFSFPQVAARTFTVAAQDAVTGQRGAVGDTLNPGDSKNVRIVLAPAVAIRGRVFFGNGSAAPGMVAELVRGSARLFAETDAEGNFVFTAVSLGAFELTLRDPIGPGLARRSVQASADVDLGSIVLDESDPQVAEMTPENASIGVPRNTALAVRFSEPVDPGSVDGTSVTLSDSQGIVGAVVALTQGDTVATITPLTPLRDQAVYTIRVARTVRDRLGKTMRQDFVGSFSTEDVTVPSIVEITPPAGVSGVTIYSPIRVKFSESVDPARFSGAPIRLTGPSGDVAGRLDYLFGNSVVVFTPNTPLAEDASYTIAIAAATDLAGNAQATPSSANFSTTDRTPPAILGLSGPATVIENAVATVVADVGSADVAVVDFFINDVFAFAARSAPFTLRLQAIPAFGAPGEQIRVSAVAIDTSGNRGTVPVTRTITITPDQPPSIQITAPPSGSARNGDRINVSVSVADDLGVTQVAYRATTGDTRDAASRVIDPAATARIETFGFNIPANAPPGSVIQIQASAVDSKGQIVQAAPVQITVLDAAPPTVTITGVSSGDRVRPGQQVTAIVAAQDAGGIASVGLSASGAALLAQTTPVDPAQPSVGVAFSFTVSASARPTDVVTLDAFAVDAAGNRTNAARVLLPVADSTPPTVRLRSANGRNDMVPGRTVDVIAEATDELGISRIELMGQGAFTLSTAKQVSPPLPSGAATFTIEVPANVAAGQVLTLQAKAVDISGNVSVPVSLALTASAVTDVVLPASMIIIAGDTAELPVQLTTPAPAGGVRVDVVSTNTGIVSSTASITFAEGETNGAVTLTGISGGTASINALIQGVPRASTTITVRGGVVRGTVLSPTLTPVPGAQVTASNGSFTVATETDASGAYFVEGLSGNVTVTVRARDPETQLLGYATGTMNRSGGHVVINVVLIAAGSFTGYVQDPLGVRAGANVKVDLFDPSDLSDPLASTFTDEQGAFIFPLVSIDTYVLEASDTQGNRGRSSASITSSGQEVDVPITYLGRGTIAGVVRAASGVPVANASVSLSAQSLFGSRPTSTINAQPDGSFRFEGIFIGSFTVSATDPVTNQGGSASGSITAHAQTVAADVELSPFAHLQGTIFRADGTTPVTGGVQVSVQFCSFGNRCFFSTQTDADGRYAFTFLPLGSFTLRVNDAATRGMAAASGQLATNGETRTLNVPLAPQGTVVVTVTDANGASISGASVTVQASSGGLSDGLNGTTASNGQVIVERVLAGSITVTATANGLSGSASSTLAANEVKSVTVQLQPTAIVQGTVFAPDGATPVSAGTVRVSRSAWPYNTYSATVASDGTYRLENLPLTTYNVRHYDSSGRLRAAGADAVLTANGQVETRDLTQVGLGTVRGRVLNPDSSSASSLHVQVQSLNPVFGGFYGATTDAAGNYEVMGVPVGRVVVQTGDISRGLLGESRGDLTTHEQVLVLDVLLLNNSINLSTYVYDANDSWFELLPTGAIRASVNNVFYGDYGSRIGGFNLDLTVNGTTVPFTGSNIGTTEDDSQEIAIRQSGIHGLGVTRKIFVPKTGFFARYLETLVNPTTEPITVDVRITSHLAGYNGSSRVIATSDGNSQLNILGADTDDRWVTLDDGGDGDPYWDGTGTPVALVFNGLGAPVRPISGSFSGSLTAEYTWRVTVPAGGMVTLMHFGAQQTSRASARATAERLEALGPEALAGINAEELASIQNFVVPEGGLSTLAPLPSIEGTITGRVLEGDGVTPVPNVQVRFDSANPYHGRRQYAYADGAGNFTLQGSIPSRRPVPVDTFTLRADHPQTGLTASVVTSVFPPDSTTTAQNVLFSNLGLVTGVLRNVDGTPVTTGANVILQRSSPYFYSWQYVSSDGSFRFGGVPAGQFSLTAYKDHPQGTGLSSAPIVVSVTAGNVTASDITLPQTGVLTGTLRTAAGAPVADAYVYWQSSGFGRYMYTDTSGRFSSTEMPAGQYTAYSSDPTNGVQVSTPFEIRAGETTDIELRYLATSTLRLQVNRTSGGGVSARVQLYNNVFSRNVQTNATGAVTISNVPFGTFTLRLAAAQTDDNAVSVSTTSELTVSASDIDATYVLPPFGTVTGVLRYAGGAPVTSFQYIRLVGTGHNGYAQLRNDGTFSFPSVPAGLPLTLSGYHPNNSSIAVQVPVTISTDGEVVTQDLVLPARVTARVTVLNADGTPFPNALIYWKDSFRSFFSYAGVTDASGIRDIANVAGTLSVRVSDMNSGITLVTRDVSLADAVEATIVPITIQVNLIRGNIEGTVFLADGTTVVPGTYVELRNVADNAYLSAVYADANGRYRFENVLPGSDGFVLRAYDPRTSAIQTQATGTLETVGETKVVDLTLPGVFGSVHATVFAGDGSTPVANAYVYVLTSESGGIAAAYTNANGQVQFDGLILPTAGLLIRTYTPSFSNYTETAVAVPPQGGVISVPLSLPGTLGRISGRVVARDGVTPLPSHYVVAYLRSADPTCVGCEEALTQVYTDSNGAFSMVILAPDAREIWVRAHSRNGDAFVEQPFAFPSQNTVHENVSFVLPVSVVSGRVTFSDGTPVAYPDVFVTAATDDGLRTFYPWDTFQDGRFIFFDVPEGAFELTAQDDDSGLTAVVAAMTDENGAASLDVVLPPSNTVNVRVLAIDGTPLADTPVVLVSDGLAYERWEYTNAAGIATFDRTPVGAAYLQTYRWDGSMYRYASAAIDVPSGNDPIAVDLQFTTGGTVRVMAKNEDGSAAAEQWVELRALGSAGPMGYHSSSLRTDVNGMVEFLDVPLGLVQVVVEGAGDDYGIATGTLSTGVVLELAPTVGNAVDLGFDLAGSDGFVYDVRNSGYLSDGGTLDERLYDAYDAAYELRVNNQYFDSVSAALEELSGRQLALGPSISGPLQITRKIFVPSDGGFARFLEIVTNPTSIAKDVRVRIDGGLGSDGDTTLHVGPASTDNTYAVTYADREGTSSPALGHVFAGAGSVAVRPTAIVFVDGEDDFEWEWRTTVPPNSTVIFMHFAVQREPADQAGAAAQAIALVNLTDVRALEGLTAAEKAAILNFIIPN